MAKVTLNGIEFEGTPEELTEITQRFNEESGVVLCGCVKVNGPMNTREYDWARIGRKPYEYRKGDVAYFFSQIIEVESVDELYVRFKVYNGVQGHKVGVYVDNIPTNLRLITPVEARFDR